MKTAVKNKTKQIFIICPVRGVTEEEKLFLNHYVNEQERKGIKVYYPPRDTDQTDPVGTEILSQNNHGIKNADEVHIYWNGKSIGSSFDFGEAYALRKPIILINPEAIKSRIIPGVKSFESVLMALRR